MSSRALGAGAVFVLVALGAVRAEAAAEASPVSRVTLLLPPCELPGLSASELRSAVALDLQAERISLAPVAWAATPTDVEVRVAVDCDAGEQLTLQAARAEQRHERVLELSEVPISQRARALSLSLTELVTLFTRPAATSSAEPASEPSAEPAPPVATPAAEKKPHAAPVTPGPAVTQAGSAPTDADPGNARLPAAWRATIAPELRLFEVTTLWGARATIERGAWRAGADVLASQADAPAGAVSTFVLHASLAYALEVLGRREGSLLEVGPRVGLGFVFMNAQAAWPALAYSAQDSYFDGALGARYSFSATRAFRLGIGAEVGYARGPVGYADGSEIVRTAGPFVSLLLDAGVAL